MEHNLSAKSNYDYSRKLQDDNIVFKTILHNWEEGVEDEVDKG